MGDDRVRSPIPAAATKLIHPYEGTMADAIASFKGYSESAPADHFSAYDTLKKKTLVPSVKMASATVQQVFDALWAKDDFVLEYREKRNDVNTTVTEWTYSPGAGDDSFAGVRNLTYTTTVAAPFTMQTPVYESERYVMVDKALTIHMSTQTPNVTMGGCFRIEVLLEFVESGDSTVMSTYWYINFIKSVSFLKGKIESTAEEGLKKAFTTCGELACVTVADKLKGKLSLAKKVRRKKEPPKVAPAPAVAPVVTTPSERSLFDSILMAGGLVLLLSVLIVLWLTVSSINAASVRLEQQRGGLGRTLAYDDDEGGHSLLPDYIHKSTTARSSYRPLGKFPRGGRGREDTVLPLRDPKKDSSFIGSPTNHPPPSPKSPHHPPRPNLSFRQPTEITAGEEAMRETATPKASTSPPSADGSLGEEDMLQMILHVDELRVSVVNISNRVNSLAWFQWLIGLLLAGLLALEALRK